MQEKGWEDVVWNILCNDSDFQSMSHCEDNGQWLLDHGRAVSKHGVPIGEAARKFLHDPRLQEHRMGDVRQWLAILSDEFSDLPREELERSLLGGYAIHTSATSALIARLGTAPAGFRKRDTVGSVPALSDSPPLPKPTLSNQFSRLKELARQSQKLHPDTCSVLEELIFEPHLSQEDLRILSNEGIHGILISSALSFVYGGPPNPEFILQLLSLSPTREESQDRCFQRLTRISRDGYFKTIEEDPNARANYIHILDEALLTGAGEISAIATELLALRGNLTLLQIPLVFDHYTRHLAYDDYGLGNQLVKWLSMVLPIVKTIFGAKEVNFKGLN